MSSLDLDVDGRILDLEDETSLGSQPQRSSALANKITAVLSATYVDSDIGEALRILDDRHVRNTAEERRRLRLDSQKEVIDCNGNIVKDFGQVAEQLKRIGSTIESLQHCIEGIRGHISAARRENGPVLDEASTLLSQKREIEIKQQLLGAFHSQFVLSDEDLDHLTSSNSGIDERFFALLSKLKRIHADCQILLGSKDQQLGLELMESCSRSLNSAYNKVFRWIQKEFQTLDLENPRMSATIRKALRILAERPVLFDKCLGFFVEAREQNLSDAFYGALTGSTVQSNDSALKPMEYYAHDSLRFVGDMLAWTHSAAVSERESLETLFISEGEQMARGIEVGRQSEPWLQEDQEAFDGRKYLLLLVNRDLARVAKALRVRIGQAVKSDDDPVVVYKIGNLIDFYRMTLFKLLGDNSNVLNTLAMLQESAIQQYQTLMREHVAAISPDGGLVSKDLEVPDFFSDAMEQMKEIIKSHDSSFTTFTPKETSFSMIMTESLEPFLRLSTEISEKLAEPANSVMAVNCLLMAKDTLLSCSSTSAELVSERMAEIEDVIDGHAARMIDYQHAYFVQTSGLHPLLAALAPLTDSPDDLAAVYSLEAFQPQALTDSSQVLDDFLPSALMDAAEILKHLKNKNLAEDITAEAASRFCEDFEHVERRLAAADSVMDTASKRNGLDEEDEATEQTSLRSLFPRTGAEIRVLLS